VEHVRKALELSERRVCRVLEQARSTQRYQERRGDDEGKLIGQMHKLVRRHPRYGYRRIWALLRGEGWKVNRKRVHRLWRREGLKVPVKQHKRRRLGCGANGIMRHSAAHRDHVWTWDFIHDRTEDGRPLKWLSVVDEYTRECLVLEVGRSLTSLDVIDSLIELFGIRGLPEHIRSDNGPEFIARALRRWLEKAEVKTLYVAPGSPWENGYAESFHSRLRDELLNAEVYTTDRWKLFGSHGQRPWFYDIIS
jgi:putative transposase